MGIFSNIEFKPALSTKFFKKISVFFIYSLRAADTPPNKYIPPKGRRVIAKFPHIEPYTSIKKSTTFLDYFFLFPF